jgi:GTP cyclohydrolase I
VPRERLNVPLGDPLRNINPELRLKIEERMAHMTNALGADGPTFRQMALDKEAEEAAEVVLRLACDLDVNDMHGKETPLRFVQMLRELTTPQPIKWKTFPNEGYDEMIIERNIPFTSLCNHHVIPFIGVAHVGYIPDKIVPGLSKIARVVQHYAKALQVQEKLTKQVADFLEENMQPLGVAVVLEAEHMCMTIRGVQVPGTTTYTAAMRGRFADHEKTAKAEFLSRINGSHR